MSAEIVKLVPETVGEGFRYVAGSANQGESLVLLEMAKHAIVFGD